MTWSLVTGGSVLIEKSDFAALTSHSLLKNPGVSEVHDFGQKLQVIATEGIGLFPFLAVFMDAGKGGVVEGAVAGFVFPNRGFDRAEADFVDGFWFGFHG